jgi:LacI family transcriptional regulator
MVKSVSKEARRAGYSIIVAESAEDSNIAQESQQGLLENRVDGLVIAAVGQDDGHLRDLRRSQTSLIMLDRWTRDHDFDAISVDDAPGEFFGR